MSPEPSTDQKPDRPITIRALARLFLRNGVLTFGGGDPTTAVLQRELVERQRWLDERDFGVCYAASRLAPGTNLLAFCTAVGWRLLRIRGALSALLLASLPGALVLVVLTHFYGSAPSGTITISAIHAALAATVGIMLASTWSLIRRPLRKRPLYAALLLVGSVVLSLAASLSPLQVIAVASGVAVLTSRFIRSA